MPRLRTVEAWPVTRHEGQPWHSDEDLAAFVGASRGIFDLYSEELAAAEISGRSSSVRFFLLDRKASDGFEVTVIERFYEGFEMAHIGVPNGFFAERPDVRIRTSLEVIHAGMRVLGAVRGWDLAALDAVRDRVSARGLRFIWTSRWKASPDRRHHARGVYWIDESGSGRVQLEIRCREHETIIARSELALAFMTVEGFKRSAATLRWDDSEVVAVIPWSGLLGDSGGLGLHVQAGTVPAGAPGPLAATGPATTVKAVAGDHPEIAEVPWVCLSSISTVCHQEYGSAFARITEKMAADSAYIAWWATTPFRSLELRVVVPDPQWDEVTPKPGARKSGEDLVLTVVRTAAQLPPASDRAAVEEVAAQDLIDAIVTMTRARALPPPPSSRAGEA